MNTALNCAQLFINQTLFTTELFPLKDDTIVGTEALSLVTLTDNIARSEQRNRRSEGQRLGKMKNVRGQIRFPR